MTAIENARNITYKAARRRDEGLEFPEPESAMAKYYATQIAGDIAREAVQEFGGYGFMNELGVDASVIWSAGGCNTKRKWGMEACLTNHIS